MPRLDVANPLAVAMAGLRAMDVVAAEVVGARVAPKALPSDVRLPRVWVARPRALGVTLAYGEQRARMR